jgi:hypothetical protein
MRKFLKWIGIVLLAFIAIALAVNAWFVWSTGARLERQLAAIRDAGDPISLADLTAKPIPPETNAAAYLQRISADAKAIWDEIYESPEFQDYHFSNAPIGHSILMPIAVQKRIRAAFDAHPKVIPVLEQAVACPYYDAQLDYTLPEEELSSDHLKTIVQWRDFARVLYFRAALFAAEGNCDDAARMVLVALRLARHFDTAPMLSSYLVALTIRDIGVEAANHALQSGPVSERTRKDLDAELAIQERMEGFVPSLKYERARMLDIFPGIAPGHNFWIVGRGIWNMRESACLELFPVFIAKASELVTHRDAQQVIASKNTSLTAVILPSFDIVFSKVAQTRALIRSLRVINAFQTHVPAGSGTAPNLAELGLPAETTTDPFNGEPLHIKKLPRGWLVYSVGRNLQDDGGKLDDGSDVGIGPPPPAAKPDEPAKK